MFPFISVQRCPRAVFYYNTNINFFFLWLSVGISASDSDFRANYDNLPNKLGKEYGHLHTQYSEYFKPPELILVK